MRQPQPIAVVSLSHDTVAAAAYEMGRHYSGERPELNVWSLQYYKGSLALDELPESERETVISMAIAIARQAALNHLKSQRSRFALDITLLCVDLPDEAYETFARVAVRDKPGYVRALEQLRSTGARIGAYLLLDGKPTLLVPEGGSDRKP